MIEGRRTSISHGRRREIGRRQNYRLIPKNPATEQHFLDLTASS